MRRRRIPGASEEDLDEERAHAGDHSTASEGWRGADVLGVSLIHRGDLALSQGEEARAVALYRESFRINQEIDDRRGVAAPVSGLGAVALARGQAEAAARAFGAVEALLERTAALLPIDRATYKESEAGSTSD